MIKKPYGFVQFLWYFTVTLLAVVVNMPLSSKNAFLRNCSLIHTKTNRDKNWGHTLFLNFLPVYLSADEGPILGNKKKMGLIVANVATAVLRIGSTAFSSTGHTVEHQRCQFSFVSPL
jgi:hypothetical protein